METSLKSSDPPLDICVWSKILPLFPGWPKGEQVMPEELDLQQGL